MKLDVWLRQNRPLEERLRVVERLCQAVNELHDRGLSLAALDPSRIELGSGGECDLSEARLGSPAPGYGAPDADGDAPPALADVYSAGAIAWEVLAGRPAGDSPPHLAKVRSDLPRELADAVMACLERSADWRPRDLTYLAQMAAAQQKGSERPRTTRATRTPRTRGTPRLGSRQPSRRTWPLFGAMIVVTALGAFAAWQYLGSGAAHSQGTATPSPPPTSVVSAPVETPPAADPTTSALNHTPIPTVAPTPVPLATALPTPTPTLPPTPVPMPTPPPTPIERPAPTPPPSVPAARPPVSTPRPPAATPTPTPQVQPPPQTMPRAVPATPPPAPVILATVSPLEVRRPGKALLDLRGSGFRPDLRARILPVRKAPRDVVVLRQKFVNSTLITVLVELGEHAETGEFAIAVEDDLGTRSQGVVFTITK